MWGKSKTLVCVCSTLCWKEQQSQNPTETENESVYFVEESTKLDRLLLFWGSVEEVSAAAAAN